MSDSLTDRYTQALERHLSGSGEAVLHQAYALGREALADGVGVLDIALLHHRALSGLLARREPEVLAARMGKAAEFLAECLSSFEMSLRGFQEANQALTAANEQLRQEMIERQRAEAELRQAQKMQVVGQLAGGVAHDFNNLLTVVLGTTDLALQRAADDEGMARLLTRTLSAAERGAHLTRQLLAFSRRQILHPEIIDPSERINGVVSLLGRSLGSHIMIETDIAEGLWSVDIDATQLDLALLNLGVNARDAMPRGGTLRFAASNRTLRDERLGLDGDYVVIEIQDTGTGIPPDILPKVFEPFFTTKDVGAGSGLGLSQVHGFAHQSGGVVDIESEVGTGTTVRLYLRAAERRQSATQPEAAAGAKSGCTILIVEDEPEVAELAASLLRAAGFSVRVAARAQSALDLLRQGEPVDMVFSDVKMPDGMSGIELAEELKARFPTIPVLLTSGYADAAVTAASKGLQIIPKPFRADELGRSVSAVLADRGPSPNQS